VGVERVSIAKVLGIASRGDKVQSVTIKMTLTYIIECVYIFHRPICISFLVYEFGRRPKRVAGDPGRG
jgi:hypothetical protein